MLSTTAAFNQQTSSGASHELYWKDANENELAGYVCERRSELAVLLECFLPEISAAC